MALSKEVTIKGAEIFIDTFETVEQMRQEGDGSKETCLKMIQQVYPRWTWYNLNTLLFCLSYAGLIEGLRIENKEIMEPIRPKLTDKAKAELEERKKVVESA